MSRVAIALHTFAHVSDSIDAYLNGEGRIVRNTSRERVHVLELQACCPVQLCTLDMKSPSFKGIPRNSTGSGLILCLAGPALDVCL